MNTSQQQTQRPAVLSDYFEACRRRMPLILTIGPFVLLLAVYLAFGLTPLYESTATVMLEASTVPKNMIETSVISYADQQIEIVQARVLTPDTLKELIKQYDPYPDETDWGPGKKAKKVLDNTSIEKVDPVTMSPVVESNAFQLHYRNPDPERAAEMTSRLAQLFLTYNQRLRSEAAEQATDFLRQQSEGINKKIAEIDGELAKLKVKAGDAFPELQQRNQAAIDRNQHDLDQLQQQILAAESRESMLALQLSQTSPNLITQSGDMTDLATVRAQLAEAEQRYTPDNPVVKRLRKAVEMLVQQNAAGSKPGKANNPQYLALQSQLDSARRELATLRAQAGQARQQMDQYSDYLKQTPGIEREYADILRRREVAQNEYQQLHDKLQNAQLAQSFEGEKLSERFTMLRPPYPSHSPVFPNRLGVILLGIALAGALCAGAVAIAEMTDSTVRNSRDLPEIPGVAVLATIPVIDNSADRRRHRVRFGTYAIVGSAFVAIDIIAIISAFFR